MMRKLFLLCLTLEVLIGCTINPVFSSPPDSRVEESHDKPALPVLNLRYTLGALDVLAITLYERPELGREVTISRLGTFQFPLIGQVQAHGLTVPQLERMLTRRLQRAHISEPHVVVTVKVYRNHHIFLLGQVRLPGVYALPDQVKLKDLIIQAQGFTAEADDFLIIVHSEQQASFGDVIPANHMRELPGTRVELRELMSGQGTPTVQLRSGDTIYVPRRITGYAALRPH